jgi:hypothetical protein
MLSVTTATSTANAPSASFLVRLGAGVVTGTIKPVGTSAVDFIARDSFARGEYQVELFGTLDPLHRRPAITSISNSILDGEPKNLFPSGNGNPGGDFVSRFDVA